MGWAKLGDDLNHVQHVVTIEVAEVLRSVVLQVCHTETDIVDQEVHI
jgi:hypothetical protein